MGSFHEALGRLWDAADDARMVQQDGRWFTWGQVRGLAENIDRQLGAAGGGPGARVAIVLDNRMESVAAVIALFRGERTLVTLNPLQPAERLSVDLAATSADFVLCPQEILHNAAIADAAGATGATVFAVDGTELVMHSTGSPGPISGDSSVAIEMLTSGTTGPPKRIPLRRNQLEASLSAALKHNDRPEIRDKPPLTGAVGMVTLPIVHIGGLWALLQALLAARPIVMLKRFTLAGWHAAIAEHKPALAGLPPAAIRSVLNADIPGQDLASLRALIAGTAPVEPALVDAFLDRYGIPILITYGATEFAGAVAGWSLKDFRASWANKKGSVGRAFPGVRLQVIAKDGAALGPGHTGRLQVASTQVGGSDDTWVTTSDLAHIDADGYLFIDGRADDVIIRGGFKVAPETVVRVLRAHDAVADAAVMGLPDERLGQVPVAAVELRADMHTSSEALREYCRLSLVAYEVPTQVFVVDELPRGAALKVDRQRLGALLEELYQSN